MSLDTQNKKCDLCGLFLAFSEFYKNKSKSDGLQSRCKDCMFEYKRTSKLPLVSPVAKRDEYFIPDIYLVGYGRTQTYQNCCLNCEKPFFCFKSIREEIDLVCPNCENKEFSIPERVISKTNFIGNIVGWICKSESVDKRRSFRNYKKVYVRDNYTCQYCNYNLRDTSEFIEFHIDHIRPWSARGGNAMSNLVVACRECNLCASNKCFTSFEEKKEYIVFERQRKAWKRLAPLAAV